MNPGDLAFRTIPPDEVLLILLVSGHVLADFLVQTEGVAARKGRQAGPLLWHALLTLLTHALLLLPFWSPTIVLPLAALGGYHLLLDALKGRAEASRPASLLAFLIDQGLHAGGLVAAWAWMRHLGVAVDTPLVPADWLSPIGGWSLIAAALAFCGKGGTAVVRSLLARYPALVPHDAAKADEYEMGRTIGILERMIVLVLVMAGQWGALGLVLAAKSIARFPELKDQHFADYYLMGTLSSILTAMVAGLAVGLALF